MAVPGSGQFTLSMVATLALSTKTPLKAIRFYLAEKEKERFLVVRPAAKDADGAIKIFPVGEFYQDHWPTGKILIAPSASFAAGRTDRKSTRLNSSHQIISYAVFCVKKQNNMC